MSYPLSHGPLLVLLLIDLYLILLREEYPCGDISDDTDSYADNCKYDPDNPDNIRIDIEITPDTAAHPCDYPILPGSRDPLFFHDILIGGKRDGCFGDSLDQCVLVTCE